MDPGKETYETNDVLELVSKRIELVDRLADGSCHVRDLQAELSVSRSTAYKGIRELETCGVVERADSGYRLSALGRTLLAEFEQYRERADALWEAESLLSFVSAEDPLPAELFVDASITHSTRHAPNRPVHVLERTVEEADTVCGFSPVVLPEYVTVFHDGLVSGALSAELLLERPVVEYMIANYPEQFRAALATGELTIRETTEMLPYGLVIVEEPDPAIAVVIYDAGGELRGTVKNDSPATVEWGRSVYRDYHSESDAVELAVDPESETDR